MKTLNKRQLSQIEKAAKNLKKSIFPVVNYCPETIGNQFADQLVKQIEQCEIMDFELGIESMQFILNATLNRLHWHLDDDEEKSDLCSSHIDSNTFFNPNNKTK